MSELPEIPVHATLPQWQRYMAEVCRVRGWNRAGELERFLLFSEEVGEYAKALRHKRKLFMETTGSPAPTGNPDLEEAQRLVAEELADLFAYLLDLAESQGVDLEQAVRRKEESNRARTWEPGCSDSGSPAES